MARLGGHLLLSWPSQLGVRWSLDNKHHQVAALDLFTIIYSQLSHSPDTEAHINAAWLSWTIHNGASCLIGISPDMTQCRCLYSELDPHVESIFTYRERMPFAWRCSGRRVAVVVINVVGSESLSIVSLITISRTVHLGRSSALTSPLLSQIMLSSQRQLLWFLSLKLDSSGFPNEKQIAWLTLITAAVFGLLSNNQKWEGRGKGLLMAEVRRSRVVFYQSIFITETEKRSRASTRECRGADWFVAANRAQSRRVRREGESTVRSSH